MNLLKLSFSYIRQRKLNTFLNVLLLAMGIATIVVLLLFSSQFEEDLQRNAEGIDLVVGAKGSPLQLILASIYHMDAPTGNISLADAERIAQQRAVKSSIPLALGDSYQGYRIVGTEHAYVERYGAEIHDGGLWKETMEVTLGASVAAERGLKVGSELVSTHGLSVGGEAHGERPMRVSGVLAKTGTVLDRLVLTSVETVWALHGEHEEEADLGEAEGSEVAENPPPSRPPMPFGGMGTQNQKEVTALLVTYSSPLAAALFPRFVNSQSNLQAASPAFETARLFNLLGLGVDVLRAFGFILILAAALGVFIALYNALKERQYDLAIMRTLGASQGKLLWHVLLEGFILAFMGTLLGIVLGHIATHLLAVSVRQAQEMEITGLIWVEAEYWLIGVAIIFGLLSALLPAIQAYRTDIARTLARG